MQRRGVSRLNTREEEGRGKSYAAALLYSGEGESVGEAALEVDMADGSCRAVAQYSTAEHRGAPCNFRCCTLYCWVYKATADLQAGGRTTYESNLSSSRFSSPFHPRLSHAALAADSPAKLNRTRFATRSCTLSVLARLVASVRTLASPSISLFCLLSYFPALGYRTTE